MIDLLESMKVFQSKSEKTLITIWLSLGKNRPISGHPFKYHNTRKFIVIWGSRGFETNLLILWTAKLISGLVWVRYNKHPINLLYSLGSKSNEPSLLEREHDDFMAGMRDLQALKPL